MDKYFLEFIKDYPVLFYIILVIGGALVISQLVTLGAKFVKWIMGKAQGKVEEELDEKELHENVTNLITKVDDIQTSVEEINEQNKQLQQSIDEVAAKSDEEDNKIREQIAEYTTVIEAFDAKLEETNKMTVLLLESDKEAIKTMITETYYNSMDKGYIEVYKLDAMERLYDKYLKENGNTFVKTLMGKLRELPAHVIE